MKLQVVMLDTHRTHMALMHLNESIPFGRRIVTLELTEEQARALKAQSVGYDGGKEIFEETGNVWLE